MKYFLDNNNMYVLTAERLVLYLAIIVLSIVIIRSLR
jgi:hypothetical protein